MKKNIIFIAGGGDEIQSKEIDSMFAKRIDGKKLMYIPVALNRDTSGFEACYDWLTGLLLKFTYEIDVPQIHMYLDPLAISESMSKYDAIYIGGGNTFKFLDFIYKNNLFEKIKNFLEEGGLIYGGSAGAIIFGSDINTVEEENNAGYVYSKGFDVLGGVSFICHYNEKLDSKIFEFVSKNKKQVIALPEESGLVIVDGKIEKQIGKVFLFNEKGKNPFLIKKKVIVCDYDNPKKYTFPSFGFGSSEKRIWNFAKTVSEIDEYEVIITGPLWLPEHVPNAKYFPKRLDQSTCDEFIKLYGKCDYLFAGHEYFDKDEWVGPFEKCANTLLSYQLHPYNYQKVSFNRKDKFLFCYSDQMLNEYSEQKPLKALLFHSGVEEEPYFTENKKDYLLWVGRLDQDKAPHYAVLAAEKLGMKIKVLGKTIYQPEYFEKNIHIFSLPHVEMMGVVFGKEKMKLISEARCAVYTIDKNYYEAGAGVLGEILSSGVPIAGMSWSGIDAICEAVNNKNFGEVALVKKDDSEEQIIEKLSQTIINCLNIDSHDTFKLGSHKYNPKFLITKLFDLVEEYKNK